MNSFEQVKRIKSKYEEELLGFENVVGVGIGKLKTTDEFCIKVYVTSKKPESQLEPDEIIPKCIEGIKTDVVETGTISAQSMDQ
jgi:hypothetical protein